MPCKVDPCSRVVWVVGELDQPAGRWCRFALGSWSASGLIHSAAQSLHRWGSWWRELVRILLISAGPGGRCRHLTHCYWNRSEELIPELSQEFCVTGYDGVQLRFEHFQQIVWFCVIWSSKFIYLPYCLAIMLPRFYTLCRSADGGLISVG